MRRVIDALAPLLENDRVEGRPGGPIARGEGHFVAPHDRCEAHLGRDHVEQRGELA